MTRASARLSPPLLFFLATRLHRFAIALLLGLPLGLWDSHSPDMIASAFFLGTCSTIALLLRHSPDLALLLTTHLIIFTINLLLTHPVEQMCHCSSA